MDNEELQELRDAIETLVAWCGRFTYKSECEEKCPFCYDDECIFKYGDNPEEWYKNRYSWFYKLREGVN